VSLSAPPIPLRPRGSATLAFTRSCLLAQLVVASVICAGASSAQTAGRPEDKRECAVASEEAQLLRIHGKLRATRVQLLLCSRDVCPPLVKHDCEQWLAEVDASMPTVVISALDAEGHDVGDVRVRVDDEPFLDKLSGTAVPIDAGEHVLRFQHGDDPPIEEKVIVREGEKNRLVEVHLQPIVALLPVAPVPVVQPPMIREEPRSTGAPILAYSLLGAGAVALGLGTYFEITQVNDFAYLMNTCSPKVLCTQAQVDVIANNRIYGGVFLATGIAAASVGAILLVTQRHVATPGPARGASVDVMPTRGGAAAILHWSF
jgi:hypothetical protein